VEELVSRKRETGSIKEQLEDQIGVTPAASDKYAVVVAE
jgi:hypothetical protein